MFLCLHYLHKSSYVRMSQNFSVNYGVCRCVMYEKTDARVSVCLTPRRYVDLTNTHFIFDTHTHTHPNVLRCNIFGYYWFNGLRRCFPVVVSASISGISNGSAHIHMHTYVYSLGTPKLCPLTGY